MYCPRADPEKPERKQFKLQFYRLLQCRAEAILKDGRWEFRQFYSDWKKENEAQVYPLFYHRNFHYRTFDNSMFYQLTVELEQWYTCILLFMYFDACFMSWVAKIHWNLKQFTMQEKKQYAHIIVMSVCNRFVNCFFLLYFQPRHCFGRCKYIPPADRPLWPQW